MCLEFVLLSFFRGGFFFPSLLWAYKEHVYIKIHIHVLRFHHSLSLVRGHYR